MSVACIAARFGRALIVCAVLLGLRPRPLCAQRVVPVSATVYTDFDADYPATPVAYLTVGFRNTTNQAVLVPIANYSCGPYLETRVITWPTDWRQFTFCFPFGLSNLAPQGTDYITFELGLKPFPPVSGTVSFTLDGVPYAVTLHPSLDADNEVVWDATIIAPSYPAVSPKGISAAIAPSNARSEAFTVTNGGSSAGTFNLVPNCGTFAASGCTASPSTITLGPGGASNVSVNYVSGALGLSTTISLRATDASTGINDSGTVTVTTASVRPPTLSISPSPSVQLTSAINGFSISICSPDGTLNGPSFTLNGSGISPTAYYAISVANCATAMQADFHSPPLWRGANTITASVTDGAGHGASGSWALSYDDTQDITPILTAPRTFLLAVPGQSYVDTFTVRNTAIAPVTYTVWAGTSGSPIDDPHPVGDFDFTDEQTFNVTLNPGQVLRVPVQYGAAAQNSSATLIFLVSWHGTTIQKAIGENITVSVPDTYVLSVTPKMTTPTTLPAGSHQWVQAFVNNTGTSSGTFALSVVCTGTATNCTLPNGSSVFASNQAVTVFYDVSASGPGQIVVRVTGPAGVANPSPPDSAIIKIVGADVSPPIMTVSPSSDGATPSVFTNLTSLVVDVCDPDGTVGTPVLTHNGAVQPGGIVTVTHVPGCLTSKHVVFPQSFSGADWIVLDVTDGIHPVEYAQWYFYDDASDHAPGIAPHADTRVPINTVVTDTFRITNPGWHTAQYSIGVPCPGSCAGPATQTISVGARQTATIPFTYTSPAVVGAGMTIAARAKYSSAYSTDSSSQSFRAVTGALLPPQITVTPPNGTIVTSPAATIVIDACDPDDQITSVSATWHGQRLPNGFLTRQVAGCASHWTETFPVTLLPWDQTLDVTAVDTTGHTVTRSVTIGWSAPLTLFQPAVRAQSFLHRVAPAITAVDTFTVTNTGSFTAAYALAPTCGAFGNCTVTPATLSVAAGASQRAVVSYTTPTVRDVPDTVKLAARYTSPYGGQIAASAARAVIVPSLEVAPLVTNGGFTGVGALDPSFVGLSLFSVTNRNSTEVTFTLSPHTDGLFSIRDADSVVTIQPGETATEIMTVVAPPIVGVSDRVTLTVSYLGADGIVRADSASTPWITRASIAAVAVTPITSTQAVFPNAVSNDVSYAVTNTGNVGVMLNETILECSGIASNCGPSGNITIFVDQTVGVGIHFDVRAGATSGVIRALLTGTGGFASYSQIVTINLALNGAFAALAVTPKGASLRSRTNRDFHQRFYITNSGNRAADVITAAECDGSAIVTCDSLDRASLHLDPQQTDSVEYHVRTSNAASSVGTMRLGASATNFATSDTGRVTLTLDAITDITVTSRLPAAAATLRDECVTAAAGADAALECGDLRLAHTLPATTTMGRTHAPTLVYDSRHHDGIVLFPADVAIGLGNQTDSIAVHVTIDGHTPVTKMFAWDASWNGQSVRRVVVPVDIKALHLTTGAYHFTIAVDALTSTGPLQQQDAGMVAVVNRTDSPFGAGWWLDGLEQLVAYTATQKLWIGADGSTRLYTQSAVDSVWTVQPAIDRPDTLTCSGSFCARHLRNGAYVRFDNTGRHVATVNSQGHVTTFHYDTNWELLTGITLPTVSLGNLFQHYTFTYSDTANAHALLSRVDAAAIPGQPRVVQVVHAPGSADILSFRGPDTTSIAFSYDAGGRLSTRTDRRHYTTSFSYDPLAGTLTGATLDMADAAIQNVTTTFCVAEAASASTCAHAPVDTSALWTTITGPRTDTVVVTRIAVNAFGAPMRIVNAHGDATQIERTDTHWPALATATVQPNGHRVMTRYDSLRALPLETVDEDPLGDGVNAHTRYTWDTKWDRVTSTVSPMGVMNTFAYDPASGDRMWQQDGRGAMSRVTFTYNANHQLSTIQQPGNSSAQVDSIAYESVTGNVAYTRSPMLFTTTFHTDPIGRIDVTTTPIDSNQTQWRVGRVTYDLLDRVLTSADSAGGQALRLENSFDAEGNLVAVNRWSDPDSAHVGTVSTQYTYDGAGRRVTERDPNAPVDQFASWEYDAAGNVTTTFNRGRSPVLMHYDALNRMVTRTIPRIGNKFGSVDDHQQFVYDAMGNLISATNAFASVTRTYTPAGLVEKDSLAVHAADMAETSMRHGYGLVNHYDLDGRRLYQDQPSNVTLGGSVVTYSYDGLTGALVGVVDPQSNLFRFTYDQAGRLDSLVMPGAVVETHHYDPDGREARRVEVGPAGLMHGDTFARDAAGRTTAATADGILGGVQAGNFVYSGLGAVIRSFLSLGDDESLHMTADAFAHLVRKREDGTESSPGPKTYDYVYEANSNRLSQVFGQLGGSSFDTLSHAYDASGNLMWQVYRQSTPVQSNEIVRRHIDGAWRVDFGYDSYGRLMSAERGTVNDGFVDTFNQLTGAAKSLGFGSFEEYRYDALGRRVWKRTHRDSYCTDQARLDPNLAAQCASATVLTVWDGSQVLYELRAAAGDALSSTQLEANLDAPENSGSGTVRDQFASVMYVHAGGIDRPLEMLRNGTPLVLHYSWRGVVDVTTNPLGQYSTCGLPFAVPGCANVRWPGTELRLSHLRPTALTVVGWYGDMAQGQLDASGAMYMRNRYYDPKTGRFTQEDPVGLAGGVNLYGFARGDPINLSDPFGLCPQCFVEAEEFFEEEAPVIEEEAIALKERWIEGAKNIIETAKAQWHHIATDKSFTERNGGPWTERFSAIFEKAGMTLKDGLNRVPVVGHVGPHAEEYHQAIYDALSSATKGLSGEAYATALQRALFKLGQLASTPGSYLNQLITKK